ncbi:MAG: hypothetical protein L0154_03800 [Chloroflexi bacterium]|nr:hypothetical protein [Chloroflexota bacterium]
MKIILSYRKFSTGDTARRIQNILTAAFGPNNVIAGTESLINYNTEGENVVIEAVMQADVLLVLIDRDWLSGDWAKDYTDSDVVALNTALFEPSTQVIPLLLDGAAMPSTAELPVTLHELTRQRVIRISSTTLDADIGRLIQQFDPRANVPNNPSYGGQQYGYAPPQPQAHIYQQQIPVVNYQRTTTADPNVVFIVELIAAWFGFLGIGHILAGNIQRGVLSLIGWWIFATVGFVIAAITVIGLCIFIPMALAIPFWSAFEARRYVMGG